MRKGILPRKERLIITAIEVIDELGIQALSTREIAKRQGISEAALFRHFKSKNELLIAVLDHFSKFDNDIFQSAKLKNLSPKESIIYFIKKTVEYYENYPAITSIMQVFDVLRYDVELCDKVRKILDNQTTMIRDLVEGAKNKGEIRIDTDCAILALIIMGSFREICLKWRFSNHEFSLKEVTLSALEMILKAFQ